MEYVCITPLQGSLMVTDGFHNKETLLNSKDLYKFIWVREGSLDLKVDHVGIHLEKDQVIPLSNLHHIQFERIEGKYISILFNSNFYCIFGSDSEVSCNGFLFAGYSRPMLMQLNDSQAKALDRIVADITREYKEEDGLKEEMLRLHLKRFIITCTRIARDTFALEPRNESAFYLFRQFIILVDRFYKEKKKVSDYALMLNRSPKTLANLFTLHDLPAPLQIIHERIVAEAKRLLLYSDMNAKEIAHILGYEDMASFSRFFRRTSGKSITEFRNQYLAK
ncbi:MAG TPA: helix-turn-helix domain-containing protein [Bacteroidales bacterium]|nr:helix-turn-helix domain-containing protein [Bacteroidales bacterium]HQB56467.1 helix-turn-helix domain-containing protein [Bacteroidales bacterium]